MIRQSTRGSNLRRSLFCFCGQWACLFSTWCCFGGVASHSRLAAAARYGAPSISCTLIIVRAFSMNFLFFDPHIRSVVHRNVRMADKCEIAAAGPVAFWWEPVEMLRKITLTGFVATLPFAVACRGSYIMRTRRP